VDPCQVFGSGEAGQLGLKGAGNVSNRGGARGCRWQVGGGGVGVSIYDTKPLSEINLSDAKEEPATVSGRQARLGKENVGPGTCDIVFAATERSSVAVTGLAGTDTAKACQLAQQAAPLVAEKLPKG
jgi:hypothetical protein